MNCRRIVSCLIAAVLLVPNGLFADDKSDHDAVKPVPRKGNWVKRHESFNRRVAQGDVDLIFIGDSITQGWEGRGKYAWARFYDQRKAVNLGIGGDRTQHVIWRLENGNLYRINPNVAVLMIGTNNSGTNSPKQIADGVTAIIEQLRTKLPQMKILLLAVFPRGPDHLDKRRQVNEKTNEIIAELDDGQYIHYLNIGPKFLKQDGKLTREIMPDLLHLSQKGYTIWAESIEEKLAALLGER